MCYVLFLFDLCALCCPLFGIVVSNTYYVVFLFDLCALCCPLFGIVVSNTYYVVTTDNTGHTSRIKTQHNMS
jgi:hypothetical protein